MSEVTHFLLELAKLTIPGLIVYLVVRQMLEQHFSARLKESRLNMQNDNHKISLPLRLQAYERLALLCERISIPSLSLRMRSGQTTVKDMRLALMYALQQEVEHNLSQQIYVSDPLWKIINVAKDQIAFMVDSTAQQFSADAPAQAYIEALLKAHAESEMPPMAHALAAIRKEVSTHL